ncbi:MAG TPA: efflux RND transporter periplasmic adaptor subunit [Anaerolineaceae bacterium]
MKKAILFLLEILLISACSVSPAATREPATPTPIPTPLAAIKPTYTVQRGDVVSKIQFNGRVAPATEEALYFRVDGRIRRVYFKEGSDVKAGDILADLTTMDALERQQASDKLDLRRAEVRYEIARLQLEQVKESIPSWRSDYFYQTAIKENELELAKIAVDEVKLRIADREANIADSRIVATLSGRLTSSRLTEGGKATALDPMAIVADLTKLEVVAKLDSTLLSQVAEGMPVSVVLTDRPGTELTGVIRKLPYGAISSNDVKITDTNTHIAITGLPESIKLQLSELVRVTVTLEKHENTLWLPPQALRTFDGRRFVIVKEGEIQRRIDIKVGIVGEDRVEILEGLQEGQVVIVQ